MPEQSSHPGARVKELLSCLHVEALGSPACKPQLTDRRGLGRLHTTHSKQPEAQHSDAVRIWNSYDCLASLGVVHPVQNDLRRPVPTGHHVARHLGVSAPGQPEVQDLHRIQRNKSGVVHMLSSVIIAALLCSPGVALWGTDLQFAVLVDGQVSRLEIL